MTLQLRDCPMCGCAAGFVHHSAGMPGTQGHDKWIAVACKHCRTTVGACDRRFREKEDAASAWNKRIAAPAAPMSAQWAPLTTRDLMATVMEADQQTRGTHTRGTTNWAAHIGLAVQRAMLAAAPQAAQSAAPGTEQQHHRDSAELRRLCGERDEARRERDECKVEMAGYAASIGHLSRLVDGQQELIGRAMGAMKALHGAAKPTDESSGDFDATVPYSDYTAFVDAHAALLSDVANSPVAVPVAAQDAEDAALLDWMQKQYLGADFAWGDPATSVIVIEIPRKASVCGNLRKDIAAARAQQQEGGAHD